MQPLIKYTGSKSPFLKEIKPLLPQTYNKVYLPFIGGGSLMSLFPKEKLYISDIVAPIIEIFKMARDSPDELKTNYLQHWNKFGESQQYYYEKRDLFNKANLLEDKKPAGLLLFFLLRVCFNGVIRFNKAGEFNTSLHVTRRGMNPERLNKIVDHWNFYLKGVEIKLEDYSETFNHGQEGDLFLVDPPYYYTTGQYQSERFNYALFLRRMIQLSQRGVKIMMFYDEKVPQEIEDMIKYSGFTKRETTKLNSSLARMNNNTTLSGNTIYTNYEII